MSEISEKDMDEIITLIRSEIYTALRDQLDRNVMMLNHKIAAQQAHRPPSH